MSEKKPRERKHDFDRMRSAAMGIIASVAHNRLSHAALLDLRQDELFSRVEWKRLSGHRQQELLGMLRGAEAAWHACGAIVWTHTVAGQVHVSPLPWGHDYGEIESSAHRWSADLSRVWFPGSNLMEPYARLAADENSQAETEAQ